MAQKMKTDREVQRRCVAVMATNAMARLPIRPAKSMLDRSMAPSDDEWEEDPAGVMEIWGGIIEQAHAQYRARPTY